MSRPVFLASTTVAFLSFAAALVLFAGVLSGGMGPRAAGPGEGETPAPTPAPTPPPAPPSWPSSEWSSVRLPHWLRPVNYTLDVDATVGSSDPSTRLGARFSVDHVIHVRSHVGPGESVRAGLLALHV